MRRYFYFTNLLIFILLIPTSVRAEEANRVVAGRVIFDANRNGRLDEGEKGLAGVPVTDGIQFVRTAADGSYSIDVARDPVIPYGPAQVVSVCWPGDTWPVGPRWFVRLSDLKPGEKADFFLRPDKQRLPFTFVHGTDPHDNLGGDKSELFRDEIARMTDRVQFCLLTGDLGYMGRDNADRAFMTIRDYTRRFPIPLLHTPGNHDIVGIHSTDWARQDSVAGYGSYTRYLGPVRWSFDYAGTHFVGLDWARVVEGGKLETGLPDVTLRWLGDDLKRLKPGTRVFLFLHHHWRPDEKFWDLAVKHRVELILAGHSHRNLDQSRRGVKTLTTMNLCGPYRLVTVAEKGHAIVDRCFGCKGISAPHHSRHCKLFLPAGNPTAQGKLLLDLAGRDVTGAVRVHEGIQPKRLEIVADLRAGTARKVGLRVGPVDVTFSGEELSVGTIRTAAVPRRGQEDLRLHLRIEGSVMTILACNRVRIETPFGDDRPIDLTLIAEDGRARLEKLQVRESRPAD